ncbi:MAG: LysM peptidoglycan-binding domain-containing protein [Firmicutes bacterium]|nr:LysM peptidoglycan-binding domain-containing protein [Bacillota bacterium]
MLEFRKEGKYKILATKFKNKNIEVYIGFSGSFPPKKIFIINKFEYNEENKKIFKYMFLYFSSKYRIPNFYDFFSLNNNFYAVFIYREEQNLVYKYNKSVCVSNFRERMKIFESISIKVHTYMTLHKIPIFLLLCATDAININVNKQNDIFFNFNLKSIHKNFKLTLNKNVKKEIIKCLSKIFAVIFEIEISSKYNKIMKIIYKKCQLAIHKSIPELVLDLKKNSKEAEIQSFFTYWKYQFTSRKSLMQKVGKIVMFPALVAAFVILMFNKLGTLNRKSRDHKPVIIGEISYAASSDDSSAKSVDTDNVIVEKLNQRKIPKIIEIPKNTPIEFSDHIVKHGETAASISERYYFNENFSSAIVSANGIKGYLVPGTILKIPDKSIIDSWIRENH